MSKSRAQIIVDLSAIRDNIELLKKNNPGCGVMAIVKADAYGLGALPISEYLSKNGIVNAFGVATCEEALSLRSAGIKDTVLILAPAFEEEYPDILKNDISPTICTYEDAKKLSEIAVSLNIKAHVHIKIDSGMGRIGFLPTKDDIQKICEIFKLKNIEPEGIFTHFAKADDEDIEPTVIQYGVFLGVIKELQEKGIEFKCIHCQNSAASLKCSFEGVNLIRAGVISYGVDPFEDGSFEDKINPVVSFKSHISFIKNVPKGTPISYGGTFTTKRDSVIATVPVGYADGIPRGLSNMGYVLINGEKARIVGRVCMDQLMVDVTDIKNVSRFDEVTIIGKDKEEVITVNTISYLSDRFSYELLTCLGKRVNRSYTERN